MIASPQIRPYQLLCVVSIKHKGERINKKSISRSPNWSSKNENKANRIIGDNFLAILTDFLIESQCIMLSMHRVGVLYNNKKKQKIAKLLEKQLSRLSVPTTKDSKKIHTKENTNN